MDPQRPVVLVVHGLLAGVEAQFLGRSILYADIIDHFVSTGNVVVFASWPTNPYDFKGSLPHLNSALVEAQRHAPRGDFGRLGIVGHSMGGGAVSHLTTPAIDRGWGGSSLWLFELAPAALVPGGNSGAQTIDVPSHTRVVVQNYDNDNILDTRLGIQQYHAYKLPPSHKQHVLVRSDYRGPLSRLDATHLSPNSTLAPEDAVRFYGIYRVGDALQQCSLLGKHCNADFTHMGRWSDGRPVRPAISTDDPVDAGPAANAFAPFGLQGECESAANPRRHSCPPTRR